MGALASYFPSMEAELQDPEDFLGAGALVEDRVASERADNDVQELTEIHASLEALAASMEANLEPDPWTPVFINHALDSIGRRTGLRFPTASLEDATVEISMEGVGDALKKIWDAIVSAVKAALKAVADFFKRVYEFVTGKKSKIESNFKKAAVAGDATPSKLASENTLDKIKDTEVVDRIMDQLEEKELARARPSELVLVTPAAAQALDRAAVVEGGENNHIVTEDITHKGKSVTVALKKEVAKSKYLKVCTIGNDFVSHASCAGIDLKRLKEGSAEISISDLTELIWETLYRAKIIREVGKSISNSVLEISEYAIETLRAYFGKESKNNPGDWNFSKRSDELDNQLFKRFESVHNEFKKLRSQSGLIPAGRRVMTFGPGKNIYTLYAESERAPLLTKYNENELLLEIPNWAQSKKASDGVTSLMIENTQKNIVADINKRFDQALEKWDSTIKWAQVQDHGDKTQLVVKYISSYCKMILNDTQAHYTRFLRSQLAMEGNIVQWADVLSGTMSRLATSKDLVEEFA